MTKIDTSNWKAFRIDSLFDIKKGTRMRKADMQDGEIAFVGATAFNNGITDRVGNNDEIHPAGTITVAYNGSVGASFYQEEDFWASADINVLYPKFQMTKNIALFLCAILKTASSKYAFVDKWRKENMEKDLIYLPVNEAGMPNWQFMDDFMANKLQTAKNHFDRLNSII